jgi:ABC-type sugar transport system ATPase subunit
VSDRIVTLRSGQIVADDQTSATTMQDVVAKIVGA